MRVVLAAIIIAVSASLAHAERRVALVFGADRYETIRPLANAVSDARAVEDALDALGFEVFTEANRDLRRMRRALADFSEDAKGADVAFVFFAGHGVEIAGQNMLLPTDASTASLDALRESSLPLEELRETVSKVAKIGLIVLDACRDDPFAMVSDPKGRGVSALRLPKTVKPGLGRMGKAENALFAFSAAPGETASDGEGANSPFTAALTKYLGTEGLEIRSVLTLVQQEVYDRSRGTQLPYVESGLPSLFFASQSADELPERERLLLAMADVSPQMRLDVERIASDAQMPLAPLYGALIGSDIANLNREERGNKLRVAAKAFTKVRDELRSLRSGDERVTTLRREAEAQLSLGAFDAARAKLTEAAGIDATSRETLKANLIERTLSEAVTHYLNGGAAQAELKHRLAIADYKIAAALFEEIQGDLVPPQSRQQHLGALAALGRISVTIGDLPEAANAFEEQLAVSQIATERYPDNFEMQLALAESRDNIGDVLFEQGRIADALDQYRAGHAVRESLVDLIPDDEELKFALSNSFERLGRIQFRQGNLETAEAHYLDKHRLGSQMVASQLPGYRWPRDLSVSDEKLGDVLRARGDLPGALRRYKDSLDRMIPIRNANADDLELSRFTSITLDRMGEVFAAQGELALAQKMFEESLALRSTLVAADPANTDWQYVLGISHERIGDVLTRLGDVNAATVAYEAKHEIVSRLANSDPTNVRWLRDLSVADERLGKLAHGRGDLAGATMYYRRSLDRMTPIRDASPTDMELNRFLSFTQDHLADVMMDQGETDAAVELYRSSLQLRERLVALDPQNADWRFILGVSHELVGKAYMRTARPAKAVIAFRQELAVMSVLLERNPASPRWRRVVSITNELLGDAHLAAGSPDEALVQYRTSLKRMTDVRDTHPDNLQMQRFTAVTLRKIGEAHFASGETNDALGAYSRSLTITKRLVAADSRNAQWQRDLLYAHKGIAEAGRDPQKNIQLAMEAAESLKDLGNFTSSDERIVDSLRRRLEKQ